MHGGVVGELSYREPGSPIVVEGIHVGAEDLFDGAVGDLSLAVSLRMVSCGEVEGGTEAAEEGLPELGCNPGVAIRNDELGQAFEAINIFQVEMGEAGSGDGLGGADEECLLGEEVYKGGDGVVLLSVVGDAGGQVCDQIHAHV